jgi:hypothetical protein
VVFYINIEEGEGMFVGHGLESVGKSGFLMG